MSAETERKTTERERPLIEAALRIIGRAGIDSVTHRAVAAEAEVSVGAVTHHFGTRDGLVDAALQFALAREVGRLRSFTLSLQSKAFDRDAWINALVNWYAKDLKVDAEAHVACYETFLAAARTTRHRAIVAEWFATWRASAELALTAAGSPTPRAHAELFVATLLGILLQQLATPRRNFAQETKDTLSELVGRLLCRN
ncbi:TetR family transcriptional regulator [Tardiphaga alba]|uniref:TetR family transcriptional regulator n=1 Tax=Tardiphaga alba TaxID=340268 RepID=A0ABX8ABK6_9BRAD|nr:TetR/AcrR family transcriptional regulator [Tardiphaga alba]QUS41159.1 TetR family transcriptional regulator [Tardiphaga alba]